MTSPGTTPGPVERPVNELPSIRKRKPLLYWTLLVAVGAMILPLVAGLIQALL